MQIGTTIRRLRLMRGLTQEDLAAVLHISAQSVSKWETGIANPDISFIPGLSAMLQVSIQELFDQSSAEESPASHEAHQSLSNRKRLSVALNQQEIDFLFAQQKHKTASGNRIVIIDDAPFIVETVREICERAGFQVIGSAADGVMAVEAADALLPDIILMDLVMPMMDGFDAARLILEAHPDITIVACTAMPYAELVEKSIALGFAGFVAKPFQPNTLIDTINGLMSK